MSDCCTPFVPGPSGGGSAGGGTASGGGGIALSAGTELASTGTVLFANSNGISFGMSGSSQVTASFAAIKSISGGTTAMTGPGVSFANANGVSFSVNGNTISASIASSGDSISFSQFNPLFAGAGNAVNFPASSLHFQQWQMPNLVCSQANALVHFSGNVGSTGTVSASLAIGIYQRNVSSLSLLASVSFSAAVSHDGTVNTSINNGIRNISMGFSTAFGKSDYWLGVLWQTASATDGQNASMSLFVANATQASALSGYLGVPINATNQEILGRGFYSVTTGALPAVAAFSEIRGTAPAAGSLPIIGFGVSL